VSFRVALYWNNFLGFQGPAVTSASFDSITYPSDKRLPPTYTPCRVSAGGPLGNIFTVERQVDTPLGDVRYIGRHPQTGEQRTDVATAAEGRDYTWVV
jgi:hypothetical protein